MSNVVGCDKWGIGKDKLRSRSNDNISSLSLDSKSNSYDSLKDLCKESESNYNKTSNNIKYRIREKKEILSSSPNIYDALEIIKKTDINLKQTYGIHLNYDYYIEKYNGSQNKTE
jgi:hypothetical protein